MSEDLTTIDLIVKLSTMTEEQAGALLTSLSDDEKQKLAIALSPKWSKFIPKYIHPLPKQLLFLSLPHREILYGGSAGGGKLLGILTKVFTPNGWSTVGDLHVGDVIFDQDGNQTTILEEYSPPPRVAYKLTFSNGEEIVCDGDHLWSVYDDNDRLQILKRTPEWRARRKLVRKDKKVKDESLRKRRFVEKPIEELPEVEPQVLTTSEIVSRFFFRGNRPNFSLPERGPLVMEEKELLLDPYVLGAWLGDGTSATGKMTVWEKEDDILIEFEKAGFKCERHSVRQKEVKAEGLKRCLDALSLCNNKHIPTQYFLGSVEQRLALLQGLMDTDGTVRNRESGACQFSTSSERLRDDFCHLLATLGIECSVWSKVGKYKNADGVVVECKVNYTINFMTSFPAFRLQRKLDLQKRDNFRPTVNRVYMTSFEEVPLVPMKCFRVDSPHSTFLVGQKMVVTHNSIALLMAALQYADVPGYKGLIVMKNFANLREIIDTSKEWLANRKDCEWHAVNQHWTFDSGAQLWFGNIDTEDDVYKYRSSSFQFIGFDEVTRLSFKQYSGLKTRARRTKKMKEAGLPVRIRCATNPGGGTDWEWVRDRFIDEEKRNPKTVFIPASWRDNKHLDVDEYSEMFEDLDIVERERLMNGDWFISREGSFIQPEWFKKVNPFDIEKSSRRVRIWDIAATAVSSKNKDPDYTAGALCSVKDGVFTIESIEYFRASPQKTEEGILSMYRQDVAKFGRAVDTYIEMGSGSGAKMAIDQLLRGPFAGLNIRAISSNIPKDERIRPLAVATENGYVQIINGAWTKQFFIECQVFGSGNKKAHDDGLDAVAYAYQKLVVSNSRRGSVKSFAGRKSGTGAGSSNQRFHILRSF